MKEYTVGIAFDGEVIGYVLSDPYEVACHDQFRDRWQATVANAPIAAGGQPRNNEYPRNLPSSPRITRIPTKHRTVEITNDLVQTTPFKVVSPKDYSTDELRDAVPNDPVETLSDLPSQADLYEILATRTAEFAEKSGVRPGLVQKKLERQLARRSVEKALQVVADDLSISSV